MTSDLASHTLADFQTNAKIYIDSIKATREPIILTINGEEEAVVIDLSTYREIEEQMESARFLAAITEAEEDIQAGRVLPLEDAIAEIKAKHGLSS